MVKCLTRRKTKQLDWSLISLSRIAAILTAIYIFFFYSLIYNHLSLIPNSDDYDVFLNFLNTYLSSSSNIHWGSLIRRHNEHVLMLNHVSALLSYYTIGELDLRVITLFGNAALLLIVIVLYFSTTVGRGENYALFLPVILILFQPQYYEATQWATAAVSNFWVVFFAFLSARLCVSEKLWIKWTALLSALGATATQGNGVLIFFAIGGVSFLCHRRRESALWLSAGMTLLLTMRGISGNLGSLSSDWLKVITTVQEKPIVMSAGCQFEA